MNWNYQRKQIRPTAKCCDWCKNFSEGFDCAEHTVLTHRMVLKMEREEEFRYCRSYKFSKTNFKRYKTMCEENGKVTLSKWF